MDYRINQVIMRVSGIYYICNIFITPTEKKNETKT